MSLSSLTVAQLKQICRDRKISGYSTLRKAEIIALIESQDVESDVPKSPKVYKIYRALSP